jgi:DNA end-binding protein Ku
MKKTLASKANSACPAPRRAAWTGCVRIGPLLAPVRAFNAVSEEEPHGLHQYHRDCGERIVSPRRCPTHGLMESGDVVLGVETLQGTVAFPTENELQELKPSKDEELVLRRFVGTADIDPVRFAGRHLYLVPASVAAGAPFRQIAAALCQLGKAAIGQLAMNGRKHLVVLLVRDDRVTMHSLYYPNQIRAIPEYETPTDSPDWNLTPLNRFISARNSRVDWNLFDDPARATMAAIVSGKPKRELKTRKRRTEGHDGNGKQKTNPAGPNRRATRVRHQPQT